MAKTLSLRHLEQSRKAAKEEVFLDIREPHTSVRVKKNQDLTLIVPIFSTNELTIDVELVGEGARVKVLGLILGKNGDDIKVSVSTIHKASSTHAETLFRSVLTDTARVHLYGLIKIEKQAQRSTDFLQGDVLLLSRDAQSELIPTLEIEADDVKASHAATVGKIDEEQLFYMTSRGIERPEAEQMIARGFFGKVLDRIEDEKVKEVIERRIISNFQLPISS